MIYTCIFPNGLSAEEKAGIGANAQITFEQRTPIVGDMVSFTDIRGNVFNYKITSVTFNVVKNQELDRIYPDNTHFYHETTTVAMDKIIPVAAVSLEATDPPAPGTPGGRHIPETPEHRQERRSQEVGDKVELGDSHDHEHEKHKKHLFRRKEE